MKYVLQYLIDHFTDLLDLHLTVSIVILFVLCVRQFLKAAPKVFSYALWGIVLLRLLVPVSIESPVSFVPERTEFSSMVEVNDVLPEISFETPQDRTDNRWQQQNTAPEAPMVLTAHSIAPQTYLTLLWILGITIMLLYSAISYLKLRCRVRASVPLRRDIYIADHIDSPFVMGIFRPVIYLPGSLADSERRYIIAHEHHHIRRGDHIFKALGFLALTIHWFNPLVWLAFSLASRDMEMSCDEAVIRKMGDAFRADYSATLLNLATGHRVFTGTPLAFGEGNPTGRVRNLAKWKKPAIWVVVICLLICLILAVCLLTDPKTERIWDLPQTVANTTVVTLNIDPLPDGYFEDRDEDGNIIFTDGVRTVGGVTCYLIPDGLYDPDEHIEALLYQMGIPDYMDDTLYFRGGMTAAGGGWMAEFESNVAEGEAPEVYRRHHFYPVVDVVYDVWFDRILLDYETTEAIRVCVKLPAEKSAEEKVWHVTIVPDRVSRTGASALFAYDGSVPGDAGAELTYGDDLSLERLVDGNWVACEELAGFQYVTGDSSYPVVDGYGMVHEWQNRFGELPDGHYRLGKLVTLNHADGSRESQMIYGMFTLPDAISSGPIPLEKLPELYGAEQAAIDGCFVQADGVARDNKELFRRFAEATYAGEPSFIRIINWYFGDDRHYDAFDLEYDGALYTITWLENGQRRSREFPYLAHFTGEKEAENVAYDAYEHYVLVHDEQLTWKNVWGSLISSHEPSYIDHMTVYSDYAYLPESPQLPDNLGRATLEFEGETLVTITDFDRIEKLFLLFTDAEYLGYEPKTHSIGCGLNLILTAQDGTTTVLELDPDNDLCRMDGEYIIYGKADEPCYIEKLWYYLDIPAWPDVVYEHCENAFRLQGVG